MNSKVEIKVKKFLAGETQRTIKDRGENLIAAGVLDSFSMIALINYIEAEFGVAVNMEELNQDNFNSIRAIAAMIQKWR